MIVAGAALAASTAMGQSPNASELTVYAAGSLRAAMTRIAEDYAAAPGGAKVKLVFGASGLLKDRLAGGERADVFASANMTHPRALAEGGQAEPVQAFARNTLCALAAPTFDLHGKTLAQRLLDSDVKLGTSTPKADPSGDYAFEMFERIEASGAAPAGSAQRLKDKALQLTGGPQSPPPPKDRNVYGQLVANGQADVFVTYCTNATLARQEVPALKVVAVPESINVGASYGLVVMRPGSAAARHFADHVLGQAGQRRLAEFGFAPPQR
jgi:ABC-type molybdate transport system substrate-binding protein